MNNRDLGFPTFLPLRTAGARDFPPLLIFHWEAGADLLLDDLDGGPVANATPFLHQTLSRPDVFAGSAIASVPVTLKTAWEVLCGVPASLTSDFREQSSHLRHECLPRALRRCCGYHSLLAKTDKELPDIPRTVFGFEATVVAEDMDGLLPKIQAQLDAWDAYGGAPVFVYFYGGDAHPPYYANKVDSSERGYVESELLDIFLALNRRTDLAAEQLAKIWPPKPQGPWSPWRREHGLAFYLGDHGEQLTGHDPPPHGNLVSPDVSRTLLAVEARAFAPDFQPHCLVRMADIYATIASAVGLKLNGSLFVGRSLLGNGSTNASHNEHAAISSFSFYRPGDLSATHFFADGHMCAAEFHRGSEGWSLHQAAWAATNWTSVDAVQNSFGGGQRLAITEKGVESCRAVAVQHLRAALRHRYHSNSLLTESNVHAAWLIATMRAAALKAKAFATWVAKAVLRPILPAPAADSDPDPNCIEPVDGRFERLQRHRENIRRIARELNVDFSSGLARGHRHNATEATSVQPEAPLLDETSRPSSSARKVKLSMAPWPSMAVASSRWGLAAFAALGAGAAVSCWELRRSQGLARYREMKRRYSETGSETRFPFYGRDFGYEVDYMLELQLQAGDRCHASYSLEALPLTHAAVLIWKRKFATGSKRKEGIDEEAVIEVVDGQRYCRHPSRPGSWWQPWPWWPSESLTRYSDWLAWPPLKEEVFDALRHYQPRPAPAPEKPTAIAARAADSEEVFVEAAELLPVAGSSSVTLVTRRKPLPGPSWILLTSPAVGLSYWSDRESSETLI
eukprot:s1417_g12.t1